MTTDYNGTIESAASIDETRIQQLVSLDRFDHAISIYQNMKSPPAKLSIDIGILLAEKKGDFEAAIKCYNKALEIQKRNGDDISRTLTELGFAYQNIGDFDSALTCHLHALGMRKLALNIEHNSIASNLIAIANAYWSQHNLSEALKYAEEAAVLTESATSMSISNTITSLAILANISYSCGNGTSALESIQRALNISKGDESVDLSIVASLLNNLGTIQYSLGLVNESRLSFVEALQVSEKCYPDGHPRLKIIKLNIDRVNEMNQQNEQKFYIPVWFSVFKNLLS